MHPVTATIDIDISVERNTIICGRNGGHVRACEGTRIVWRSGNEFTVQFSPFAVENPGTPDLTNLPAWPFEENPADLRKPQIMHQATLLPDVPLVGYKYTLTLGNLTLDPIIIVDKKI